MGRWKRGFTSITLQPTVDAPAIARRFAAGAVAPGMADDDLDVLELLVSELVTDAVQQESAWLNVGIDAGDPVTRVEVIDGISPVDSMDQEDSENFELRLLDGLADRWGVDPCADGRKVWFELRITA